MINSMVLRFEENGVSVGWAAVSEIVLRLCEQCFCLKLITCICHIYHYLSTLAHHSSSTLISEFHDTFASLVTVSPPLDAALIPITAAAPERDLHKGAARVTCGIHGAERRTGSPSSHPMTRCRDGSQGTNPLPQVHQYRWRRFPGPISGWDKLPRDGEWNAIH